MYHKESDPHTGMKRECSLATYSSKRNTDSTEMISLSAAVCTKAYNPSAVKQPDQQRCGIEPDGVANR